MHKRDVTLDSIDHRLLERYQLDTQVPARVLSRAVGLSTAAVQRRLKRLRKAGVIRREVAELDPKLVGRPVTCLVAVSLEHQREADMARFGKKMLALGEVQQCYEVTGEAADFMLVVLVESMEAYQAFTRQRLLDDQNVRSFTTHVVLERVKVGVSVTVPGALGSAR
jgi:Lrp/AsnC family transcriptional regulator, leucine-responsive regulatory protein